jgi:hypothetical protein
MVSLCAALVLGALLLAAQGVTYRPPVHGPPGAYVLGGALALMGAALGGAWALARRAPAAVLPAIVLLALLPGFAVNGRRWLQRDAVHELTATAPGEVRRVLDPTLGGAAALRLETDGVHLVVPAGSVGFVELRPLPAGEASWDLPRALLSPLRPDVGEEIGWRATVTTDGPYFILLDTDRLEVQLTTWGLTVKGPDGRWQDVARPVPRGTAQEWTLRRAAGVTTLALGGEVLWRGAGGGPDGKPDGGPDGAPFRYVRLGETRTDAEHGGRLVLHAVRLSRFLT